MPQVIKSSSSGSSGPSKKKSDKSGSGIKFSGDISELPKPLLVAIGIVALLFIVFMVDRFVVPLRPKAADTDKVAPPPGMPDIPPYNSKAWQEGGKKVTPGIPPAEAMERMNGGAPAPPPTQ